MHVLDRFVKVTPVGPDSELNDVMDAVIERAMASKPSVQQTALEAMVELTVRSAHNGGGGSAVVERLIAKATHKNVKISECCMRALDAIAKSDGCP